LADYSCCNSHPIASACGDLNHWVAPLGTAPAQHRHPRRGRALIREMATEALDARAKIADRPRNLRAGHTNCALIRSLPGMGAVLAAEPKCGSGLHGRISRADEVVCAFVWSVVSRISQ
jgi:hypothetical protein